LNVLWTNPAIGVHTVTAMVRDDRGASNLSNVSIIVTNDPPSITAQPQSQSVIAGTNVTFTVISTGAGPLNYRWRFNGTDLAGSSAYPSYTITNAQPIHSGQYSVVISNAFGAVTSSPAVLSVSYALDTVATPGGAVTRTPNRVSYSPDTSVTLTAITAWPYLFNGWSGDIGGTNNPIVVTMTTNLSAVAQFVLATSEVIVDNPQATSTGSWVTVTRATDKYGPDYLQIGAVSGSTPTAIATFTPELPGPGNYDIYIWYPSIIKGSATVPILVSSGGSNVTVYVNQSTASGGWKLLLTNRFFAQGTNGFTRVSNNDAPSGGRSVSADAVRWVFSTNQPASPPTIVSQPSNQIVANGADVILSLAALGTPPLAYQWRFNNSEVAGATNTSFILKPVQFTNGGNYQVVVSNPVGAVTSTVAKLTVLAPPQILVQPQRQHVPAGSNVTFTVTAAGSAPLAYRWRFDGTPITGATNSALLLTNVQPTSEGGYDVTVTNAVGAVTSTVAVLTLNARPTVSLVSPTNGQSFFSRTNITIEVMANDSDGEVRLVEVFVNADKLSELTNAPYLLTWSNVTHGQYSLKSVATDNWGATNVSPVVQINVVRHEPMILLSHPLVSQSQFSFSFDTMEEWHYRVEFLDPGGTTNWLTVTNFEGSGSTAFVTNVLSTNLLRFFRVVAE